MYLFSHDTNKQYESRKKEWQKNIKSSLKHMQLNLGAKYFVDIVKIWGIRVLGWIRKWCSIIGCGLLERWYRIGWMICILDIWSNIFENAVRFVNFLANILFDLLFALIRYTQLCPGAFECSTRTIQFAAKLGIFTVNFFTVMLRQARWGLSYSLWRRLFWIQGKYADILLPVQNSTKYLCYNNCI